MSAISAAADQFGRALADFDTTLRASQGWRDDQRVRLERAHLVPLRAEANRYRAALHELGSALDGVHRLLQD